MSSLDSLEVTHTLRMLVPHTLRMLVPHTLRMLVPHMLRTPVPGCPHWTHWKTRRRRSCIRQHTSAHVSIYTSAYVSIRQHTSEYVIGRHDGDDPAYVSIRQHTSAYVSIRQHTSAYVSIRQHTSAYECPHWTHGRTFRRRSCSSLCVSICTFVKVQQVKST